MKPNFNNCLDIKGLKFFTKEICPYYCCFFTHKKDSGGASIHRIDESFPLEPSLVLFPNLHRKIIPKILPGHQNSDQNQ